MKLLRKLFGTKHKVAPVKPAPLPVAEVKPPKPVITLDVVEQTHDENELLKLASEGATSQLRQAAAEKIQQRERLEQLAKTAKTKDKNVFRIVKAKLDIFRADDARQAEFETSALRLCEKLEKHAYLEADALFKARLAILQQEWELLAAQVSETLTARYQAALAVCEAKIQAQADAIAAEEERITLDQQARELASSAVDNLQQLGRELLAKAHIGDDEFTTFNLKVQELGQAMRLAANRAIPLDDLNKSFEQGKQQLLNLLDQIKTSGTLTQLSEQIAQADNSETAQKLRAKFNQQLNQAKQLVADLPELITAAKARVDDWFAGWNTKEQAARDALRHYSELTRKGLWAAEQGFVRKARGIHKELQEKQAQLGELPKLLQAKWEEFETQLHKLGDWHEFAVTPKKEALIEQMQSLIGSKMAPEDLASKIHDLQDSWKEVSRGGQQQDDDLWQQFQQASAQAYAPCKEFFEAQATARDNNLGKRRELVSQLQTYLADYDWDNALWKDVEQTLKVARQEWQTYWPVPRKAGNDIQKEFENLMEQLFGKITAELDRNKQAKQHLIEQARQLIASDDLRTATEQAKQLQAKWKTIGKSWHKEDQQLWQEFRQQCDALFARRNQEADAARQQRQAQVEQAKELIGKLKGYAGLALTELDAAKAEIEATKLAFDNLSLPRESAKALSEQLQAALAAISSTRQSARVQAENQRWQDLFGAAEAIRQYELALIAASDDQAVTVIAAKAAAEEYLNNTSRWPTGTLPLLQQRLAKAPTLEATGEAERAQQLRLLCIRAEILTGKPTPESDKALRMNYQVQQMQQAFGQRDSQIEALVQEWIMVGGVSDPDYPALLARFQDSRASA